MCAALSPLDIQSNLKLIQDLAECKTNNFTELDFIRIFKYLNRDELSLFGTEARTVQKRMEAQRQWLDMVEIFTPDEELDESFIQKDALKRHVEMIGRYMCDVRYMRNVGYGLDIDDLQATKAVRDAFASRAPKLSYLQLTDNINETFVAALKYLPSLRELSWTGLKAESRKLDKALRNCPSLKVVDLQNVGLHPGKCMLTMPSQIEEVHVAGLIYKHNIKVEGACEKKDGIENGRACPWRRKEPDMFELFPMSLIKHYPKSLKKLTLDGLFRYDFSHALDLHFDFSELVKHCPDLNFIRMDGVDSIRLRFIHSDALHKLKKLETCFISTTKVIVRLRDCLFTNSLQILVLDMTMHELDLDLPRLAVLKLEGVAQQHVENSALLKIVRRANQIQALILASSPNHELPHQVDGVLAPLGDELSRLEHLDISQLHLASWDDLTAFVTQLAANPERQSGLPLTIYGKLAKIRNIAPSSSSDNEQVNGDDSWKDLQKILAALTWVAGRLGMRDKLRFVSRSRAGSRGASPSSRPSISALQALTPANLANAAFNSSLNVLTCAAICQLISYTY